MRFGFILPFGDARAVADLASEAESAGWDGLFVSDPVWGVDPAVSLAAAALQTTRLRLGTMLTPLSRHRPWKLAGEWAALDNLSGGRTILSVGLGATDTGFAAFGEQTDRRLRAELLDEGLAIIDGLWRGQPFAFDGKHYRVTPTDFQPPAPPVQRPRIPIWVVGAWPRPRSLARAARWDGLIPTLAPAGASSLTPDQVRDRLDPALLREMLDWINARRPAGPYDAVQEGETPGDDPEAAAELVRPWADSGATWWLETRWGASDLAEVRQRLRQGPPAR